jgi:hypothetical protein
MEEVKKKIENVEAELGRLPAGDPERPGLQTQLGALLQEKLFLMQHAQGAMPPSVTRTSCVSRWLSALPAACAL